VVFAFLALAPDEWALAQAQTRGDGSLRAEYQYIRTGTFYDANFEFNYWTTDSHIAVPSGDYAFRPLDGFAHFPTCKSASTEHSSTAIRTTQRPWWIDFQPLDRRFIDDGDYHGGFQDHRRRSVPGAGRPLTVSLYIAYGVPTTDYLLRQGGHGMNLWNIPVGVDLTYIRISPTGISAATWPVLGTATGHQCRLLAGLPVRRLLVQAAPRSMSCDRQVHPRRLVMPGFHRRSPTAIT
jgi:hypothetical protein